MVGGAETGFENILHQVRLADVVALVEQAQLHRPAAHLVDIDPGAIVADAEHDLGTVARNFDRDFSRFRLAFLDALHRGFDPVRERVSDDMFERRDHAVEHLVIDFVFFAGDYQLSLFAELLAALPHQSAQARQQAGKLHHAAFDQAVLQVGIDARLL